MRKVGLLRVSKGDATTGEFDSQEDLKQPEEAQAAEPAAEAVEEKIPEEAPSETPNETPEVSEEPKEQM